MRIGVLFSSGKDSVNTLWYYLEQGWDVACLISLLPKDPDSWMFQSPLPELVEAQAAALGVPALFADTSGEKESELDDLQAILVEAKERYAIKGVAAGALASDYQHERISRICEGIGLKTFSPLWHKDQAALLREMVGAGFDIRMTRVAADGLDESWLGKRLGPEDLDRLEALHERTGFHVAGEGGEFETIVLDGPIFSKPITLESKTRMDGECRGDLIITKVMG